MAAETHLLTRFDVNTRSRFVAPRRETPAYVPDLIQVNQCMNDGDPHDAEVSGARSG